MMLIPPYKPLFFVSTSFIASAFVRATGSGETGSITIIVAGIGAFGLVVSAFVTVMFQRRDKDPLAGRMYKDMRDDLEHARRYTDKLESVLRHNGIEIPEEDEAGRTG